MMEQIKQLSQDLLGEQAETIENKRMDFIVTSNKGTLIHAGCCNCGRF
jgi:hypothetical protein